MRRITLIFSLFATLAISAPAYAQDASSDTYAGKGQVADQVVSGGDGPTSSSGTAPTAQVSDAQPASSGSLPFTGFDVGLLIAGGVVLLGVGVAMRRMARPHRLHV
ncbi:MAG: hypothetical protein QOH62_1544 [Solirubrobacteraceae bacterium]|jgi:hypothetical protein|nr:hypothetical protein [Solirubrobacteraceae bacterium]